MRKIKTFFSISCLLTASLFFSCTPDYVTDASSTINNPGNSSGQSINLNFTSGEFIGVLNNNFFQNGTGAATKTNMNGEYTYFLLYTNGVNQFNGFIVNKNSSQLADSASENSIHITRDGKMYTSTSGTYTLTQEQVVSSVAGTDVIKCKFTFNGTFEVTTMGSFEVIETGVKINGTVIF